MDPATVDRRSTPIAGINESQLPNRRMTIAGMEGGLDARILSKDMSGPATRVVTFGAGWGSRLAGVFNADLEILVIDGEVEVAGRLLTAKDYASIPGGRVVAGMRAQTAGRALFMTAAPLRYDTATGGAPARVLIVHSADVEWRPQPEHEGRFVKELRTGSSGEAWLSGSLEWINEDGPWHRHASGEECYVLDGEITLTEWAESTPETHTYRPGGYVWRPPGVLHAGSGSHAPDAAVTFHRAPGGPLETEWVDTAALGASDG